MKLKDTISDEVKQRLLIIYGVHDLDEIVNLDQLIITAEIIEITKPKDDKPRENKINDKIN